VDNLIHHHTNFIITNS